MQPDDLKEPASELRDLLGEVDDMWGRLEDSPLAGSVAALDHVTQLLLLQLVEAEDDRLTLQSAVDYKSVFEPPIGEDEFRWSFWSQLSGADLHARLREDIYPWLSSLSGNDVAPPLLLESPPILTASTPLLAELVSALRSIDLPSRSNRVRGTVYEHLISKIKFEKEEAKKQGKYLTPRHLTKAVVRMLDVKPGETVLDPCCGTGGFLVAAQQHILETHTSARMLELGRQAGLGPVGDLLTDEDRTWMHSELLKGADSSRDMARICCMNLLLHGIRSPDLRETDAMSQTYPHQTVASVVATNPPFVKRDRSISDEFSVTTKDTPDLAVQLAIDSLWPGGRAAVIVPEGFLFSTQTKARVEIRKRLLENHQIDGVVSLPAGVFEPSVGTKTSVLLFTKSGTTDRVWMYEMTADGYTLDKKRQPAPENDIPDLLASWAERLEGPRSFTVSVDEIRNNEYDLSVSRYVPFVVPDVEHQGTLALAAELAEIGTEIHNRTSRIQQLIASNREFKNQEPSD